MIAYCHTTSVEVYVAILNVDGTGMFRLFLTEMFVTMTPHSRQRTENYIKWKFGENVAIKVLLVIFQWQKNGKIQYFFEIYIFRLIKDGIFGGKIIWSLWSITGIAIHI